MFFDNYFDELKRTLEQIDLTAIEKLKTYLNEARINGNHVFVLGNGGSAATASHWVCDFGKGINAIDTKRMKIMAPSDHTSIFTAYGNDNSYDQVLVEQMINFLQPNDLVVSLSVSGNSGNLIEALKYAKKLMPRPYVLLEIMMVSLLVSLT